jgi:ATP-dependent DNA helicase DinG
MPDVLPLGTARPHYPNDPLPSWVTSLREHQVTAVREIVEAFDEGADVVFLDAPVGAGKTLIGELVRREMDVQQGLYVCTDKALQDQFLRDFQYAKVLKGRANYIPPRALRDITCEDCTYRGAGTECTWCEPVSSCPYRVAKLTALGARDPVTRQWDGGAKVAVLNTSYMLSAGNFTASMRKYRLAVADECDMLEGALIGFVEYMVPTWIGELLGLSYPKKSVRKPTLVAWLRDAASIGAAWMNDPSNNGRLDVKREGRLSGWIAATRATADHLQADVDASKKHEDDNSDEDQSGRWIRDYGDDRNPVRTLKLRPVTVSQFGVKNLWRLAHKWLLMSGTIISSDEMADSLGLPLDYRTVTIPSSFPVENRPIVLAPIANVTAKATEDDYDALIYAIEAVAAKHDGRILVHTVSYKLTKMLYESCQTPGRRKFQYTSAAGKNDALRRYLDTPNAILFAPSMDRGVDLKGDKCAVQIIAKCPFPSLGDKQVSSRLRLPGGQQWYSVKTVRDIVQMTGRGVRSETDQCITYILDQQFTRNVWGKNKMLFPAYFREAVDLRADVRDLIKPRKAA